MFTHLHVHSHFSFLDAVASPEDLAKSVASKGMTALALTEHGNIHSTYEHWKQCKANNIKPILGIEGYFLLDNDFLSAIENKTRPQYLHIVLLAKNELGWIELKKLFKNSSETRFYYRPIFTEKLLAGIDVSNIVCLTACLRGFFAPEHKHELHVLNDIFKGNIWCEIQPYISKEQYQVNQNAIAFNKKRIVATNDVHYLNNGDKLYQDILLSIRAKKTLKEMRASDDLYNTDQLFLKTREEMQEAFLKHHKYISPELIETALNNTNNIASLIEEYDIVPKESCFPEFKTNGNKKDYLTSWLKSVLLNGKYSPIYFQRLEKEIDVIYSTGYTDYFLIVSDFVNKARAKGICIGPGRGSVCGSLVAYLLGITETDPIKFNLTFERFMNKERAALENAAPDIDLDFQRSRRDEVKEIIRKIYGKNCVANVCNFGMLGVKSAIKDIASVVYGYKPSDINALTKHLDTTAFVQATKEELLEDYEKAKRSFDPLKDFMDGNPEIDTAVKVLMGTPKSVGVHASGIVISNKDLISFAPLAYHGGLRSVGTKKDIATEWNLKNLAEANILKVDILGLNTLDTINNAVKLIKKNYNLDVDLKNINLEDDKVLELFRLGKLQGIFQFGSAPHMKQLTMRVQPTKFKHIIDLCAIDRSAVLSINLHETYIKRKNGEEQIEYMHPDMAEILGDTYGIPLFQEQTARLVQKFAGFKAEEADSFRVAIKKKKKSILEPYKKKFLYGMLKRGYTKDLAKHIWHLCSAASGYNFNIAHSTGYAMIAYRCAWLKKYYPAEFYASIMTGQLSKNAEKDKIKLKQYLEEARGFGINVIAPNINFPCSKFKLLNKDGKFSIQYPLSGLKGIGKNIIIDVIKERRKGKFTSFVDFLSRVKIGLTQIRPLILSNAFRDLCSKRKTLQTYFIKSKKKKIVVCKSCRTLFVNDKIGKTLKCSCENPNLIEESVDNCMKYSFPKFYEVPAFGFCFNPMAKYLKVLKAAECKNPSIVWNEENVDKFIKIPGMLDRISVINDKNNNEMAFVDFSYYGITFNLVLFSKEWLRYKTKMVKSHVYVMGAILSAPGKLRLGPGAIVDADEYLEMNK